MNSFLFLFIPVYDRFPSLSRGGKKKKESYRSPLSTSTHLILPFSTRLKKEKKKKFLFKPAIETRSSFVTDVSTSSSNFSPFHPHLQFETINKRSYEFKFFNVVDAFSISSSPPFLFILSSLSFSLLSSFPSFFLRTFEQIILNSATEDDFRRLERNRGDARFFARKFEDAGREVDEQEARDIAGEIACNKNNCRPMFYASR